MESEEVLTACVSLHPQALDWNLCPETPITWLNLYVQVEAQQDGHNFLVPQFSQETYIQITQVLEPRLLLTEMPPYWADL